MKNIIQFRLNAYTLSEVANAWQCTVRDIIQLAIDGRLRLSVRTRHCKLLEFDEEGEISNQNSLFPLSLNRYLFVGVDDLIEIDRSGEIEAFIFFDESEDMLVFEKSLTIKSEHLRIVDDERRRFEAELSGEQPNIDNPMSPSEQIKKPHGNSENNAKKREQILGAALSVVASFSSLCTNNTGKYEATKIAAMIDEKSLLFWPETGEPPLARETIERLISSHLKKIERDPENSLVEDQMSDNQT